MVRSVILALALTAAGPALAFDAGSLPKGEAEKLLAELIHVGVAGANCPDANLSEADVDTLNAAADALAGVLGLDADALDGAAWYGKAFDAYEAGSDAFCAEWLPRAAEALKTVAK